MDANKFHFDKMMVMHLYGLEQHAYTCVTEMKRSEIKTTYGVASNWSAYER